MSWQYDRAAVAREYVPFLEDLHCGALANVQLHSKLLKFPKDAHWFCPACGDEDPSIFNNPDEPDEDCSVSEKHKRIEESRARLDVAIEHCFVLGTTEQDFPEAHEWRPQFEAELHKQLSRCYECVRAYHQGRPKLTEGLEAYVPYF